MNDYITTMSDLTLKEIESNFLIYSDNQLKLNAVIQNLHELCNTSWGWLGANIKDD